MAYNSPTKGYELRRLDGNAADIDKRGRRFITVGETMKETAKALKEISESEELKSKGTDKLAEAAGETHGDLTKAGDRYELSGPVLVTYAAALDTAQTWIHPRIDDIEKAEKAFIAAEDAKHDAESVVSDQGTTWPWEDQPTDAEKSAAATGLSDAKGDYNSAKNDRDDLWSEFETHFETWSDAYDKAVDDLDAAFEKAGNNDNFWDDIGDFVDVLGWVIVGLAIVALFVAGGPLFWVLIGLSALHLALTLGRYANGNVGLSDVLWSAVGLLSFGVAGGLTKLGSKGAPALAKVVSEGRSVTVAAVKGSLPAVRWFAPWRAVSNPVRVGFAGLRSGSAPMFVNPINSIRNGFEGAQSLGYLNRLSGYAAKFPNSVGEFVNATRPAVTASRGVQLAQVWNFIGGTGTGIGSSSAVGLMPKFG